MKNNSGQALVVLIAFAAIATTIIASIVVISISNNIAAEHSQDGAIAYDVAQSGAENAMLRLLRDSTYTGETLTVGSGSAAIVVSGSATKTILSTGSAGIYKRTVQVVASDSAGILTVTSWKEL